MVLGRLCFSCWDLCVPGEAGAVQPRGPGRVGAVRGEARAKACGCWVPCSTIAALLFREIRILTGCLGIWHPAVALPLVVLWTESKDVGKGFRCIRMVNNICLNFDAFHGGVRDGTNTVLWKWCEGDNQRWKIVPWCKPLATHMTLAFQYTSLALLDGVSFQY
jgi:hypothetical protein